LSESVSNLFKIREVILTLMGLTLLCLGVVSLLCSVSVLIISFKIIYQTVDMLNI